MATDRGPDRGRPRGPRPQRPPGPGGPPSAPGGPAGRAGEENAAAAQRAVPPANYREHLEQEHGLRVVPEPGWPTEIKRWRLVRGDENNQKSLEVYDGTLPEALAHFYRLLHPQPRRSGR